MLDAVLREVYGEEGMRVCNEQIRAYFILKYKGAAKQGKPVNEYYLKRYPEILDPNWIEPKVG